MNTINLGYDYNVWISCNYQLPIHWSFDNAPHLILSGNTGSGKTVEALYIINQALNITKNIYIADFKGFGELSHLVPDAHYASNDECDNLLEAYYMDFKKSKSSGTKNPSFLIFDEFNSYALNKSKNELDVLYKMISELAFMSRVVGMRLILIGQDWHSTTLSTGIRNQFLKLHLGRINKEQVGMLFPSCDIKDLIPPPHTGYCLTENAFSQIQIPYIDKVDLLRKLIYYKSTH